MTRRGTPEHHASLARMHNRREVERAPLLAHAGLVPVHTADEMREREGRIMAAVEGSHRGMQFRWREEDADAVNQFLKATGRIDLVAEAGVIYPLGTLNDVLLTSHRAWIRRVPLGRPVGIGAVYFDPLANRLGRAGIRARHAAVMTFLRKRSPLPA